MQLQGHEHSSRHACMHARHGIAWHAIAKRSPMGVVYYIYMTRTTKSDKIPPITYLYGFKQRRTVDISMFIYIYMERWRNPDSEPI